MWTVAVFVVLILPAVVFFWWFRRTGMYRAHRQYGIYPGETWTARSSMKWHGDLRPPLRPDLRPEANQVPPSLRRWWRRQGRPPDSNDTT